MENVSKWSFSFLLKTHDFYIWAAAEQRPKELAPFLHGRGKKNADDLLCKTLERHIKICL